MTLKFNHLLLERQRKKQTTAYHGTSSTFLKSILSNGITANPGKKVWQDDPDASADHLSRATVGGSYWTENLSTALGAGGQAKRKFGGRAIIVVAKLSKQSAYADEDSIVNYLVSDFKITLREFGFVNATTALAFFEEVPSNLNDATKKFGLLLHKHLSTNSKHPINQQLVDKSFDVLLKRTVSYELRDNSDAFKRNWFYGKEKADKPAKDAEYSQWVPPKEFENYNMWDQKVVEVLDSITRHYRETVMSDDFNVTFRMNEDIGFTGRNHITSIIEVVHVKTGPVELIPRYGKVSHKFFSDFENAWGKDVVVKENRNNKLKHLILSILREELEELDEQNVLVGGSVSATGSGGGTDHDMMWSGDTKTSNKKENREQ